MSNRKSGGFRLAAGRCLYCESSFEKLVSGGRKPRSDRYCSKRCTVMAQHAARAPGVRVRRHRRLRLADRKYLRLIVNRYRPLMGECCSCKAVFYRARKGERFCTDDCRTAAAKAERQRWRKSPAHRKQKLAEKVRRRVRVRAQTTELVDPLAVFERDGWTCRICSRPTPACLRGSTDHRAPELDHIIPLARGGAHSYANTQCACRKCNGDKGDRLQVAA
jgi:5-methylcytosine-specific restriction endonuclease McrA